MNVIEALLHTKLVHLGGVHAGKRVRYRVLITRNYTVLHGPAKPTETLANIEF